MIQHTGFRAILLKINSFIAGVIKKNLNSTFLLVIATVVAYSNFLVGYRLTWDDVNWHYQAMLGERQSQEFVSNLAIEQGRIGHLIQGALAMQSNLVADQLWFRVLVTCIYAINFFLLTYIVSKCLSLKFGKLAIALLIALQPLAYMHMGPNSFPLFLTVPFFALLALQAFEFRYLISNLNPRSKVKSLFVVVAFPIQLLAAASSEYALILLVSLLLIKFALFAEARESSANQSKKNLKHSLLRDATLIASSLVMYLVFRWQHPSSYEGNRADGFETPLKIFGVIFGHPVWGLSPTHIASQTIASNLRWTSDIGALDAVLAILIGVLIFGAIKLIDWPSVESIPKRKVVIGLLLAFAFVFLPTLPLAITKKYQDWCSLSSCGYLDSRYSAFGLIMLVAFFLSFIVAKLQQNKNLLVNLVAASAAVLATVTFLFNSHIRNDMADFTKPYAKATLVNCLNPNKMKEIAPSALVDPLQRIVAADINAYWHTFFRHYQTDNCTNLDARRKLLLQELENTQRQWLTDSQINFNEKDSRSYLLAGWSGTENWGTWSDGASSTMFLPITDQGHRTYAVSLGIQVFTDPKSSIRKLNITVNGVESHIELTKETSKIDFKSSLTKLKGVSGIFIKFAFESTFSPQSLGLSEIDARNLGLGLVTANIIPVN